MKVPDSQRNNSQRKKPKEQGLCQGKVPESLSPALSWERNRPSVKEPQFVLPPGLTWLATVSHFYPVACCLEQFPPVSLLPCCLSSLVGSIVFIDFTIHLCPVWSPH